MKGMTMDAGLEKVIAAETILSRIDGQNGELIIRGRPIEALAAEYEFESVIHMLWSGFFDDLPDFPEFKKRLGRARLDQFNKLAPDLPRLASLSSPMEKVRAGLSLAHDGNDLETAINVIARAGIVLAYSGGADPARRPDPAKGHAEDIITILRGRPAPKLAAGLNAYLITVAEHGLNASTFAARVVASTQAGLLSAAIAGISALKGPLHGGAPGPVLDMLDAIGDPKNTSDWIAQTLTDGGRIMGFGHRVYRARDPRADALKAALAGLPKSAGRLAAAETIELEILRVLAKHKPGRTLETNVEYYTALLLEAIGFDRSAFTAVFACGRLAGWIAHAREQLATKRIVRPKSIYIGPELAA